MLGNAALHPVLPASESKPREAVVFGEVGA